MFRSNTIRTCRAGHQRNATSAYRSERARASLVYFTISIPLERRQAQSKLQGANNLAV